MMHTADTFSLWHKKLELSNAWLTRIGAGVIAATLGVGVLWGSTAPIAGAVVAPGIVVATGLNQTVQHLEGGIIDQILVHEGDQVKEGQLLIKLNETAADANLLRMESQLDGLRLLEARLLAERDGREVTFPQDIVARKSDAVVGDLLQGQQREFSTRKESLASQVLVYEKQIASMQEQIAGYEAQRLSNEQQEGLIRDELADTQELFDKGLAQKSRVLALQRAAAELVGNKGQLAAQKAQAEATIAETQNRILATRQAWMEKTVADLRDTQMQVADFTERLRAAQDVAQRTEIRASASGTIVKLHYNTIGGVIQPGQPIADILPTAALEIEGRISTQDINRVSVGRAANLRFPALRSRVTPVVPGELKYVSADRIADPRTGESYYTVRIRLADRLDGDEKAAAGKLQPGMPAEVFVQTGERTFFQYLFAPVSDIMAHSLREQ